MDVTIRPFQPHEAEAAIALWQRCGLLRPWNDPRKDIARKLLMQPELFLIAAQGERLVATAMAGYDGHRGSVYYLAVEPELQARGLGRQLMTAVETRLNELGCPKLNILIRTSNLKVRTFYTALGYAPDDAVSFGKRLISDLEPNTGASDRSGQS